MTSEALELATGGADAIGWREHGTLDGDNCKHCAEDFGLAPLPHCPTALVLDGAGTRRQRSATRASATGTGPSTLGAQGRRLIRALPTCFPLLSRRASCRAPSMLIRPRTPA